MGTRWLAATLALLLAACQVRATGDRPVVPRPSDAGGSSVAREEAPLRARYANAAALQVQRGKATYYSDALAGRSTASGEPYDPRAFTAAHRKLPFGSVVRVTVEATGANVYVRINDRGPFAGHGRIIDVSRAAAEELGLIRPGVLDVRVEVLGQEPR
jgi:rare lipoprotein A